METGLFWWRVGGRRRRSRSDGDDKEGGEKVCVRVSGRICVSPCGRKQRASRERTKYSTHLCVCVSFIKRRAAVIEERKERWPLAGLQGRDEKERAEEQEGKPRGRGRKREDGGGTASCVKPERPSIVSPSSRFSSLLLGSLPHLSLFSFHPFHYLTFSPSVCLFSLPWGL